jgi:hypothetical protein
MRTAHSVALSEPGRHCWNMNERVVPGIGALKCRKGRAVREEVTVVNRPMARALITGLVTAIGSALIALVYSAVTGKPFGGGSIASAAIGSALAGFVAASVAVWFSDRRRKEIS